MLMGEPMNMQAGSLYFLVGYKCSDKEIIKQAEGMECDIGEGIDCKGKEQKQREARIGGLHL